MSQALASVAGLRFWNEREIQLRDQAIQSLALRLRNALTDLNQAWRFERVETPVIMPVSGLSCAYTERDTFRLKTPLAGEEQTLRAETTPGTYAMAVDYLRNTKMKPPLCVWQAGLSFRTEANDGATAEKLRFNQFYQCEFQCVYAADSKADYALAAKSAVTIAVMDITGRSVRLVASDRLPSYSTETMDVEAEWNSDFIEVCSISKRTDFPEVPGFKPLAVLEVAVGLDRLVAVSQGKP